MVSGNVLKAQFKHLEEVYQMEKSSFVKYIHVHVIFHSSTQMNKNRNIVALKGMSCENPSLFPNVKDTYEFLKIFITWLKLLKAFMKVRGSMMIGMPHEMLVRHK